MSFDEGLLAWIQECLEPLGSVTMRKMIGGATLYLDGTVFAILGRDDLWFKADAESDSLWDEVRCEKFRVEFKDGRTETMNYRRAPSEVHDDPDAMQHWARLAVQAGERGTAKRKPRKKTTEI